MLYAEFRNQLEDALQEAGLFFDGVDRTVETIDLADTARRWKVYICRAARRSAEPFHVSAEISFYWTPHRRGSSTHLRRKPPYGASWQEEAPG
jgi:hypothetical protein